MLKIKNYIIRTNAASVGSTVKSTRMIQVLSLAETIETKSVVSVLLFCVVKESISLVYYSRERLGEFNMFYSKVIKSSTARHVLTAQESDYKLHILVVNY